MPHSREYQREKRERYKAQGLCYVCGRNERSATQLKCTTCIEKYQKPYDPEYRLQRYKLRAFEMYGGCKCVCCGETNHIFLSIDHIDNNGADHRRSLGWYRTGKTGGNIYNWLSARGWPPGFQVLCHNCNHGKHLNKGVCPHQQLATAS